MKKSLLTLSFLAMAMGAMAVPAKRGLWQTLTLSDGTEVKAQLAGDEFAHYWEAADGTVYVAEGDSYAVADKVALTASSAERRMKANKARQARVKKNAIGDFTHYTGAKKGLIILVEFSDVSFKTGNDLDLYKRIANEENFTSSQGFRGSVYDYFKAQSYGKFSLTFDVVGPVKMSKGFAYYGKDSGGEGNDSHPGEMVAAACQAVADQVNFADYDWDGDGYVDQVMCIYAGKGQADGGSSNTIWPHEWELSESDYGSTLSLDGVKVETYAVANELSSSNSIEGIGVICHEFSHCLGLPDMYDVNYGGNYGMGEWSLMDSGSYNGDTFCPAGYSSFDKYTCGWVEPVELTRNTEVSGMKALSDSPEVYMIRNDAYDNEYYLLENRQLKSWDAELPGSGLLVLYVDFDRNIWENNIVNTNISSYYSSYYGYPMNDHQRCTIFHANNSTSSYSSDGAPYPYGKNDSLTNTSKPAATLYHANTDGKKLMNKAVTNIKRNSNGTMSFTFRNGGSATVVPEGTLFYESFDQCNGTGGNDDMWTSTIASSNFVPDNEGWDVIKPYGGNKCARFGNSKSVGVATTPTFAIDGEATMTFNAATAWPKDGTTLNLSVDGNATISPSSITVESGHWTSYEITLKGSGNVTVTFTPGKRFLLDEVLVVKNNTSVGINDAHAAKATGRIYTLDGRFVGLDMQSLGHGIYVVDGKKVIR